MAAGQMMYSMPNVSQAYRQVSLDVNTPIWMRGPGLATASFAIESAMDELAHELGIDPIELQPAQRTQRGRVEQPAVLHPAAA